MLQPVRKYEFAKKIAQAAALALCFSSLMTASALAAKDGPALRPIPDATLKKVEPVATTKAVAVTKTATTTAAKESSLLDATKTKVDVKSKAETKTLNAKAKADAKADAKANAKVEAKAKSEADAQAKADGKAAKKAARTGRGASMVPPPPPNTPTMLSDPAMMAMGSGLYGMQVEYMSKEALKDRIKEVSIQYKDASVQLAAKKSSQAELQDRAKNFEQLYAEGVVSRRELETTQKDANGSNDDIARLENNCRELKSLLERMNKRLAAVTPKPFTSKTSKITVKKKTSVRPKAAK